MPCVVFFIFASGVPVTGEDPWSVRPLASSVPAHSQHLVSGVSKVLTTVRTFRWKLNINVLVGVWIGVTCFSFRGMLGPNKFLWPFWFPVAVARKRFDVHFNLEARISGNTTLA